LHAYKGTTNIRGTLIALAGRVRYSGKATYIRSCG
jgi:hypothetical protein